MAASTVGRVMNWFTISEELSRPVTAGEVISTSKIAAVSFDMDVNVTIGDLGAAFSLPEGSALGIDVRTTKISIDVDAMMFAMSA